MKSKLYILAVLALLLGWSCTDNLDRFPEAKLDPRNFFSNEEELSAYANTFYTILPGNIYNECVDNVLQTSLPAEMRDGRLIPGTGGGWTWTDLRKFNTLLEYSVNCPDEDVRNRYNAVARFFRAYFYFEKVKRFGDVPWYDKQMGSDDPDLYKPRDSRDYVMQKVIEDLDFAIDKLPSDKDVYRVTKWTALALKSRACLFEGTFRKYHNITIEGGKDWTYYLEQSADASLEFIRNSGYTLYTGGTSNVVYRDLFATLAPRTEEIILARDYNASLGVVHAANFYTLGVTYGRPGLNKKVVNYYLMADGTRFTDKAGYATMEFKDECSGRDPRLAQTIRTPGYTRIGQTAKLAPDLAVSVTGYQPVKFVMGTAYDQFDKSESDLPLFRTAEVYLNYAEAKAELGTLTQNDIDISIKKLRDRVSMPNLDMVAANATPDPYLESAETGYPNVAGTNKGVILEIRRERGVELIMEGFRYYDMMRWKEGNAFTKPLLGIYIPAPGEYDLDDNGTIDVGFYLTESDQNSGTAPLKLLINSTVYFSEGNYGYVSPHKNLPGSWDEGRDYLYPIPTEERMLTKGALKQNPGWNDNLPY